MMKQETIESEFERVSVTVQSKREAYSTPLTEEEVSAALDAYADGQ